jgi:hypothetical protein
MQSVDLRGDYTEYFLDETKKIPQKYLDSVCQYKQAEKTCRYICLSVKGYICVKKTPIKEMLDDRVKNNSMKAVGDNCAGLGKIR